MPFEISVATPVRYTLGFSDHRADDQPLSAASCRATSRRARCGRVRSGTTPLPRASRWSAAAVGSPLSAVVPATASTRTLALDGFRVDGEGVEPVGARPGKDATGVAGDPCSAPIDPTAAKEAPCATARGSRDATRNGDGRGGAWRAGAGFGDAIRQARAEASAAHSGANDGHAAACTTTAQDDAIRAGLRRRDPQRHGAAVTLGDAGMGTDADDDAAPSGETATQPVEAADNLPRFPEGAVRPSGSRATAAPVCRRGRWPMPTACRPCR